MSAACCSNHPVAQAGWMCAVCGPLCPACVARVRADERTHYDTCVHCDAHVPPICVPGPIDDFPALLRFHFLGQPSLRLLWGLLVALLWGELTLDVELYARGLVALLLTLFAAALLGSAFCALVIDTARGPDELVRSESLALVAEAIRPAWPIIALLTLVLLEPVELRRWTGQPGEHWIWNPQLLLFNALVGALLPRAALRQAAQSGGATPGLAVRLPMSITLLGVVAGVLIHLFLWASASSAAISLWGWAEPVRVLVVLFTLALARVSGLLLHAKAPELGFPLPARYQRPLMEHVTPTGVAAPKAPVAPGRNYEPIEL